MMKEMMEMLDGVEVVVDAGKAVMADGKIDLSDLPIAMDLATKSAQLVSAVEGADQIPAEVPTYTAVEISALVDKLYAICRKARA